MRADYQIKSARIFQILAAMPRLAARLGFFIPKISPPASLGIVAKFFGEKVRFGSKPKHIREILVRKINIGLRVWP